MERLIVHVFSAPDAINLRFWWWSGGWSFTLITFSLGLSKDGFGNGDICLSEWINPFWGLGDGENYMLIFL